MESINIGVVFDCISGNSGITEEFIYAHILSDKLKYEVLSSSTIEATKLGAIPYCTNNNGEFISIFKDKLGILVARNGKAGLMTFLKKGNYTINDHAYILYLKEDFKKNSKIDSEAKEEIFLKWFICKYQYLLYHYSSKTDNATWNKTAFFKFSEITVDEEFEQIEFSKRYDKIQNLLSELNSINNNLNNILEKTFSIDLSNDITSLKINKVLDYASRNDCLSEEGIYNFSPKTTTDSTIKVLSGSSSEILYGEISSKTQKIHKIENKQGLVVASRGKAGKLTYIPKGNYSTNTNAFILFLKDDFKIENKLLKNEDEEIYLKFLKIYLEPIFIDLSSNSDVSVFPLTKIFEELEIPRFVLNDEMKQIVNKYDQLLLMQIKIEKYITHLNNITEKTITNAS